MNTIKLSQWKLLCTLPYQADFSKHMQEGLDIPNLTDWMDAKVPGSVYQDLENAGYIENPYFSTNSLNCEWVANRWWIYKTTFTLKNNDLSDTLKLTFKGIDYSAQIYLNGVKIGYHEGMYIPFEAVINEHVKIDEENILVCVLEHAPFADAQPGYTSKTKYLKARYNYKWDFAVRLVNLGLYDDVTITRHNIVSISHSFIRPVKVENNKWDIFVELELDGYIDGEADISINSNIQRINDTAKIQHTEKVKITKGYNKYITKLQVDDPILWWPNGYGIQALNDFNISISYDGGISDFQKHRIAFRTLKYIHADGRSDALPYNVVINGKKIFLKGTNLVPLCSMIGSITKEDLTMKLKAAKNCNINLFRIWGGGHIESEAFYDLCDEYGIMLWQEFTMSSSGCDDVPSKDKHFLDLLHKAAVHNIKLKRNHVCLTFWTGGNELTNEKYLGSEDHEGHPATFEDSTLAMLKGLTDVLSPDVMMLPSSGSGPNALLKVGDIGNNHDVHGPWGYIGVYDHYNYYNDSDSIVHGEFGCGGISNLDSIKRFFEPEDQKLFIANENNAWRHHSGGWDTYAMRERFIFGDLHSIPFEDYIKVNQFIQAESLRYSLEANRRRQWKCVGEMTWQFNEPWPNVQCSNVLDYYGGKKLAYYFMRDAYESVSTSLKYNKLFFKAGEVFEGQVYIINDNETSDYKIDCTVKALSGDILSSTTFKGTVIEDISQCAGEISVELPSDLTGSFSVILNTTCGEHTSTKEYLMLIADREISIELSEYDKKMIKQFDNKRFANDIDGLRADTTPVIDYVDRYLASLK